MSDVAKLHIAIWKNNIPEISRLIQNGVDVNAVFQEETAFTKAVASCNFEAADLIIDSRLFNPNAKNTLDHSPLFVAVKDGKLDLVTRLLSMGAYVNDVDARGRSPLAVCAWKDSADIAKLLIEHGAEVDHADTRGQTPLHYACTNVAIKFLQVLLQHGCDVNNRSNCGRTPLMEALPSIYIHTVANKRFSDMLSACEMLIKAHCDVNSRDEKGKTALHLAVESNIIPSVCLLAESGCELNIRDDSGKTPFHVAISHKRPLYDIARFLLYYGANPTLEMSESKSPTPVSPLLVVLKLTLLPSERKIRWSRDLFLRCMQRSIYPSISESNFATKSKPHDANQDGESDVGESVEMQFLSWVAADTPCSLQHQAALKVRQMLGSRKIIHKINLLPVCPYLKESLNLGLRPDWIPLSAICKFYLHITDHMNDKVRNFLDSGKNFSLPINGKAALAVALEIGNVEAAKMLLTTQRSHSALISSSGDGPLHVASRYGRGEIIDNLLRLPGDINMKNFHGQTPLLVATEAGHFAIAAMLIKRGADLGCVGKHNVSVLHWAVGGGALDVVELLLEKGMDPNVQDEFGNTPLHIAACMGGIFNQNRVSLPGGYLHKIVEFLDPRRMRTDGDYLPRLIEKYKETAGLIKCLLRNGGNPTKTNVDLKTPLQYATNFKAIEVFFSLCGAKMP